MFPNFFFLFSILLQKHLKLKSFSSEFIAAVEQNQWEVLPLKGEMITVLSENSTAAVVFLTCPQKHAVVFLAHCQVETWQEMFLF